MQTTNPKYGEPYLNVYSTLKLQLGEYLKQNKLLKDSASGYRSPHGLTQSGIQICKPCDASVGELPRFKLDLKRDWELPVSN